MYVCSRSSIETAYQQLGRAFGLLPHTLCYSVKANSNLFILRVLGGFGSGFDIVSGGELDRLRRIGVAGRRIIFSGVGKTRDEIREAMRYPGRSAGDRGILLFNIESATELEVILSEVAHHVQAGGGRVAGAIRVNPHVLAPTFGRGTPRRNSALNGKRRGASIVCIEILDGLCGAGSRLTSARRF
jgi:diaminopimelate decarboxylase